MPRQLLVYGSLRRDRENNRFMRNCTFLSEVRVPGFDLFELGWYPGIKPNPSNDLGVVGEIYHLPEDGGETLNSLDMYEGYVSDDPPRSLFTREEITVNGEPTFVYVYNRDVEGFAEKVQSGDWNKHGVFP